MTGRVSCACHPAPAPAIPSELLEPALAGAFALCARQLLRSGRRQSDFVVLAEQARAIMRVAMCNRVDGTANGVHANLASSNLLALCERLRDAPADDRAALLAPLESYA